MTVVESKDAKEHFLQLVKGQFDRRFTQTDVLQKNRTRAWECFSSLGLPTRKTESYQYIWLRGLFEQHYHFPEECIEFSQVASHVHLQAAQSYFVFINGQLRLDLSVATGLPKQVAILPISEAIKVYGTFLNNRWSKLHKEELDPFAALNSALSPDGLFIYIPPKVDVTPPIQFLFISTGEKPLLVNPHVQMFVGANSRLTCLSKQVYATPACCINQMIDMTLEENAHVKLEQIAYGASDKIWHFDALRASLKRNSSLNVVHTTDGAAAIRHDYRVTLAGENAEVNLNGIWDLSDKKEAHTHVLIDHQAPACRSLQLFKGILRDHSRSSFEGKILVQQAAQKTEAFQLNNNLLLSDTAHADSKPNLEIFADDVKASHGATFGQLDADQLFYMQTRGFSKKDAENILVNSFASEVQDRITFR